MSGGLVSEPHQYPRERTISELFEEQAALSPDATAVAFGGELLTYQELDRRAGDLAACLVELGAGPETLVGVCAQRSLEMVLGLLAILKAGAAYLPLDPGYPPDRLAFMVRDGAAGIVLAQRHLLDRLPRQAGTIVCLPEAGSDLPQPLGSSPPGSRAAPARRASADNLAYVMYTSGSTGRPKGTAVPHRAVVRLVRGADYAELTAADVFLQFSPISFDAATFEIWGALLNGGRLVVPPPDLATLEDLGRIIVSRGVTTLWLTAGLFQQMVDDHPEALLGVRQLLAGGDVLSPAHVRRLLPRMRGRLINGYGPTENTTFTACCDVSALGWESGPVPIGRPISRTLVRILGLEMEPVPAGASGELYAGGDGLARGYLGAPDMTAEKFVPDPFSAEPGARLYRTGDLARFRPDGNIEFLGRIDQQVKIRGFRVELGEIEAALGQHPAVREVVVVGREDSPGEKSLAAYVVPARDGGAAPGPGELRAFLMARLPDYMVPSVFVWLDALPLSPNGKVDRRALPAPGPRLPDLADGFVAPRTAEERTLAEIWSQVLGVERVGVHDDFFELGGHSLRAMQVISRARDRLGVDIELERFFETPTVAALAAACGIAGRRVGPDAPPPIERIPRERPRASRAGSLRPGPPPTDRGREP